MKFRSLMVLALLLAIILSAQGGGKSIAQNPTLTIWTDNQRLPVIVELSKAFTEEYGVDVVVEPQGTENTMNTMLQGAASGDGPDLFTIPHDNIGQLVESGVVTPIDLGDKAAEFLPNALDGFTYNGELYGVPFAIENIGLFRNTDLVPEAPATWAEAAAIGMQLVDEGLVDYAIALPDLGYNYYPVYSAFGGYIFGTDEAGTYLPDDVGMDSEGMIAGAQWAYDLVRAGYASDNLEWEAAHVQFETGQAAFIMTGPWAVGRFKAIGIPYAISAFPAAEEGGEPGAPFIGVQGFMVNANSENALLAQTYLTEFIATEEAQQYFFDHDPRPSAWQSIFDATEDPDMLGFAQAGANGQPMPAIPAMGSVWTAWGDAGTLIVTGELDPTEAMQSAAEQIRTQIAEASE